jgi:hypothetical protein
MNKTLQTVYVSTNEDTTLHLARREGEWNAINSSMNLLGSLKEQQAILLTQEEYNTLIKQQTDGWISVEKQTPICYQSGDNDEGQGEYNDLWTEVVSKVEDDNVSVNAYKDTIAWLQERFNITRKK